MDNTAISELLRKVAIAYEINDENKFRVAAYSKAADSIASFPERLYDLWKSGRLNDIPSVGKGIRTHLEELFSTGKVKHFEEIFSSIPQGTFDLIKIRSIGPKTAVKLSRELIKFPYRGKTVYERLEFALDNHAIQKMDGFGAKREEDIRKAFVDFKEGQKKKKRLLLREADLIGQHICTYMLNNKFVQRVDVMGSLRRRKETIGDIDIACITSSPTEAINHFCSYSDIKTIVDKGTQGATIVISSGVQIDLRIAGKESYGGMLQYFTGSKYHNIRLRDYALSKGFSVSEYGIKKLNSKSNKPIMFPSEEKFYNYLGLSLIPPEARENKGEIERAAEKQFPELIQVSDIKGDLHVHSNFDLFSSHDIGLSCFEDIIETACKLGYSYIGIADHNPKVTGLTVRQICSILKKRNKLIE